MPISVRGGAVLPPTDFEAPNGPLGSLRAGLTALLLGTTRLFLAVASAI